jgi:GNAT superfamily N-acetyltransferase
MDKWQIEPFQKGHRRDGFSCGQPALDEFLSSRVSQYEKRKLGKTYVAVRAEDTLVLAYYTLAASAIANDSLPESLGKKLPKHPIPVVLLARLAVDVKHQGQRLGEHLLWDALNRTLALSDAIGIHSVIVDAIDDSAAKFYRKYGFVPLTSEPSRLILPVSTIESLR